MAAEKMAQDSPEMAQKILDALWHLERTAPYPDSTTAAMLRDKYHRRMRAVIDTFEIPEISKAFDALKVFCHDAKARGASYQEVQSAIESFTSRYRDSIGPESIDSRGTPIWTDQWVATLQRLKDGRYSVTIQA